MGVTLDDVKARVASYRDRWERCLRQPPEVFVPYCEMKGHDPEQFRAFILGLWQGADELAKWIAEEEGAQVLEEVVAGCGERNTDS